MIRRKNSAGDGNQMEVHLLSKGERCLERLARLHRAELLSLQGAFAPP